MNYMLLILDDVKAQAKLPKAEMDRLVRSHGTFYKMLKAKGKLVMGQRLRPEISRVVLRKGAPQVMDGPFAETREFLGGFYLIRCKDRAEALEWARRCPILPGDAIEVRPVWE